MLNLISTFFQEKVTMCKAELDSARTVLTLRIDFWEKKTSLLPSKWRKNNLIATGLEKIV
jgi:hypothetical protein